MESFLERGKFRWCRDDFEKMKKKKKIRSFKEFYNFNFVFNIINLESSVNVIQWMIRIE